MKNVPDVGDVCAKSIYDYFRDQRHLEEIGRLKAHGLHFSADQQAETVSDAIAGKVIVISGTFSISRDEMKALIEKHGGKNSGSISSRTSFLLAGAKPGPEKIRRCEELGVPVMDEDSFMALLPAEVKAVPQTEYVEQLSLF